MTEFEIIDGKLVEVHKHEWKVLDHSFNYGEVPLGGAIWKELGCSICKKSTYKKGILSPFREVVWDEEL